jgi:hypothetical protein
MKKTFKGSAGDMINKIAKVLHVFEKHLADFTAYDPQLNAAYATAWNAAWLNAAHLLPLKEEEATVSADKRLTQESERVLALCRDKYIQVKYFAGRAFPNNKAVLKEFGAGAYSKVCTSRLRMVGFMEALHGVAEKYKVQLIAAGLTQPQIDEINSLATELRNKNTAQQLKKKERPTETRKRIEAQNTFYAYGQRVVEAARFVYRDNEVLRKEFVLAQRHHPKNTTQWVNISAGAVRKLTLVSLVKKTKSTLTNTGTESIEYWQADRISETPSLTKYLGAGETMHIEATAPAKKFLVIKNTAHKAVRLVVRKEKVS